jgi:hypothetical protein
MTDLAAHLRIFDISPSDELMQKRQAAINKLADQFRELSAPHQILVLANDLAGAIAFEGGLSSALASQVESAIRDQNPSFVQEDQEVQLTTCALLAALGILEGAKPAGDRLLRSDVLAAGLWSALSFQKPRSEPKLEALRRELLDRAAHLALQTAESARRRMPVPAAPFAVAETEAWPGIEKNWNAGPLKALSALQFNAALDREELDFLWWALGDWSVLLNARLSSPNAGAAAAIASAIEAGMLLRRVPSEAHKHLVLRHVTEQKSETLSDLVKHLGDHRLMLSKPFDNNAALPACPHVFPLLTALSTSQVCGSGGRETRTMVEWASRALLEAGILHVALVPDVIS